MAAPVISPITSFNLYTRGQSFALLLAATELPVSVFAVTGTESTDVINATAHGLPNQMQVKFTALTGGAGLTAGTTYYVVSTAANTFQLALTPGGAAINFTTNITAATISAAIWTCIGSDQDGMAITLADLGLTFDTAHGVLKGAFKAAGFYDLKFTATNGAGTSAAVYLPIGIEDSGFAVDATTGIEVDVETGAVTRTFGSAVAASASTAAVPVLYGKHGSQMLITVVFRKQGQQLGMDVVELQLGIKQYEPEQIIDLTDGTFYALGGGFRILLDLDKVAVATALGDYEMDNETLFTALAELRWKHYEQVTSGAPVQLISRSRNFLFQIERDIIPN